MEYLVKLRKEHHKTQQEMADYLSISRQAYGNYESGFRKPDYETLLKLSEYFNVSVDQLLRGGSEAKTESDYISDGSDPLAGELFAAYGEVKDAFDADDIADIKLFMQMKAARKREKEKEDGNQ